MKLHRKLFTEDKSSSNIKKKIGKAGIVAGSGLGAYAGIQAGSALRNAAKHAKLEKEYWKGVGLENEFKTGLKNSLKEAEIISSRFNYKKLNDFSKNLEGHPKYLAKSARAIKLAKGAGAAGLVTAGVGGTLYAIGKKKSKKAKNKED